MGNYYPKFENGNPNTLVLSHSFYEECLEYADAHRLYQYNMYRIS